MTPSFYLAMGTLLELEGGFVEDDNGAGACNFGITQRFLETHHIPLTPDQLTKEKAAQIYRKYFWNELNLDKLQHHFLAELIFICAVNVGPKTAVSLLQNVLFIPEDGILGPQTREAINEVQVWDLVNYFRARMGCYYINLAQNPKNRRFLKGWFKRLYA